MFTNLRIINKLLISFVFITLLSVPTAYISLNHAYSVWKVFTNITNVIFPRVQALFEMQNTANEIKILTLNFDFNQLESIQSEGSIAATYKYNILATLAEMEKWEDIYRKYSPDENLLNLKELDTLKNKIILSSLRIMELKEQKASSAEINKTTDALKSAQDQISSMINSTIALELSDLKKNQESAYKTTRNLLGVALLISIASIIFSILISIFLARIISKPIVALSEISTEVTKGNLHTPIDIRSQDEVGQLASNIQLMIKSLLSANK